jgi:hypothetical protein
MEIIFLMIWNKNVLTLFSMTCNHGFWEIFNALILFVFRHPVNRSGFVENLCTHSSTFRLIPPFWIFLQGCIILNVYIYIFYYNSLCIMLSILIFHCLRTPNILSACISNLNLQPTASGVNIVAEHNTL